MKIHCWRCWLGLIGALLVVAALIVVSGIVPATASSGHLPITAWALEFAMERTVSTHSIGIDVPPLDNEALVTRGAGHYEVGCAWCHGVPSSMQPRIALQMTPHPPDLSEEVDKWEAQQLFYIVRHGVKFTGMPGWASPHRDDEVWAVVAFLRRYPELSMDEYSQLSGRHEVIEARRNALRRPGEEKQHSQDLPSAPAVVIERCVTCHASNGLGRQANPQLAGQLSEYLVASLKAYRSGERYSGIMGPIAASLSDQEITQAAQYFEALQPPAAGSVLPNAQLVEEGRLIAEKGLPKQRAGACMECHGTEEHDRAERYPYLAGQRSDYLIQQLHLFRSGDRGGTDRAHIMTEMAEMLTDRQIAAAAAYYSSLGVRKSNADSE